MGIPGSLLVLALLLFPGPGEGLAALHFDDPGEPEVLAKEILDRMSDEEALAQTFMLGWVGATPSPLIIDWIQGRNIGGVK
ncbi:MAG: glycoside hydrolase family 3 protein, partial [Treponema sp.]|nr:glycoside hydrolase family 3 protein [Treponema sp.]